MPARRLVKIPLARKISLLFGTAVLVTIVATLLFPWRRMMALNEQTLLVEAKGIATAAYQAVDLHRPDWADAAATLTARWPHLARELELPARCPDLVSAASLVGGGFRQEAIDHLRRNRAQRYYWRIQDDGSRFRFAMAVRGVETDPHPHVLRGVIDVRLPIPEVAGVWNSVVTVLAGASGAVLAILVFYMVTQRLVLSPVKSLRRVAMQVTSGDIDVRSAIPSGDEFESLSDALNEMLTHLREAQVSQAKVNRSLDIRLGELAETNVALYESNRLKGEFLANVSHELRTPLVSIIGFAELLRDAWDHPDADRARLARYSENILVSGRGLLELINDLLDLVKIEAGKMELHITEFSLRTLCQDLIDFVQPLADKRNQQLILALGEDIPRMQSDAGRVKQVLYNLLSNAIKFTPTGGSTSLAVDRSDEAWVRLVVRDTGPGIPKEQQESIFEKFHQLDASETREHEGTGLGLAITHELVLMLGGSIRVDSEPGEGATFTVALPVTRKEENRTWRVRLT